MKVIIAGSRDITEISIQEIVDMSGFQITEIVCGKARGVDTLGEEWAVKNGIPVTLFPADWDKYRGAKGKNPAGIIRNKKMADYADSAIVIHNGSPGSLNMIFEMKQRKKPVYEYEV